MKNFRLFFSTIFVLCYVTVQSQNSINRAICSPETARVDAHQIICPSIVENEGFLPVIYMAFDENGMFSRFYSEALEITSSIFSGAQVLMVNCGAGSALLNYFTDTDFEININGTTKAIAVRNDWPVNYYEGVISESEVWDNSFIRHITSDLIIADGATIQVEAGCKVKIDAEINIIVQGLLIVNGTPESPVIFTNSENNISWGGIRLSNATSKSTFTHTIFTGGGGNDDFIFGHSDSQPVVFTNSSDVDFSGCYFIDNPGKGIGGVSCLISIDNCVFNRCDMGAEFQKCVVNIDHSHFSEMPDGDGILEDDDNDCLYFYHYLNTMPDTPSTVKNSVFCIGEDDAIDHNGAKLVIENCFINGFENEGIAASSANYVSVFNCLILNCEQGIEAGYGHPDVFVDHCVVVNCDVGIRFGDSYYWGCTGQMYVENTILFDNIKNVWNFDLLTQDSVANAIMISYSITNDAHYDNYPFCFSAIPLFLPDYYLEEGSPGVNQASDDCDIGLYRCNTGMNDQQHPHSDFLIFPNPCSGLLKIDVSSAPKVKLKISLFTLDGKMIFTQIIQTDKTQIEIDLTAMLNKSQIVILKIEDGINLPLLQNVIFIKSR